jgi:hypothetical protein
MNSRKRGSTLFLVVIIAAALSIGAYSVLDLVNTEFRLNKRAAIYNEARQAAESLIQSSIVDLKGRLENETAFPIDALSPSKNPLYISSEFVGVYSDSVNLSYLVIPSKTKYTSESEFNTQPTEIIGGQVPPGEWRYIDPRIPGNQFDELAGTRVYERNIEIISKATVTREQVGTAVAYARQYLQVRDAPLFAYAIFYNLPMEIAPGPQMEVFGNVHSNLDSWFQASSSLDIHSKVTIAGDMNHGRHPDSGKSNSGGAVKIANSSGTLVSLQDSDGWMTSGAEDFYDRSNQAYGGNLQTADHGVLPQNPVGVNDYIEDTNSSTSAKESFNSAYTLIQPPLSEADLQIPDASADPEGYAEALVLNEVEKQKYSYKAGLTIKVDNSGNLSFVSYQRAADGTLTYDGAGNPITELLTPNPTQPIATYHPFTEQSGTITSGLHDKRQAEDLNTIEIDVEALKDLIHGNDSAEWGGLPEHQPSEWWNGIVYVDFPQDGSHGSRDDNVNPAISGWAVKLTDAKVIPNPSFAHADDLYGMTLATNQMLYIKGHYNADGDRSTGSATEPDSAGDFAQQDREAPAALVADSITFLSQNWSDAKSNKSSKYRNATHTEISAAILTGNVPSGKSGSNSYSGGVENFPRFLEKWKSKDLLMRGSVVALFESEVGVRRFGHSDVYSAPNRKWGFHSKFGEGYLPPGTLNTRRYRAVDFEMLDKTTYEEYVERIKSNY